MQEFEDQQQDTPDTIDNIYTPDHWRTEADKLTDEIRQSARMLIPEEARYLVAHYYISQENRKRSGNQTRAMEKRDESTVLVDWLMKNNKTMESNIQSLLLAYASTHEASQWAMSITGIGPVIASGLSAHIDITKADTVGSIWRFAGLDPTLEWGKNQKRPFNAKLKVLCWKVGESFVKVRNKESDIYGKIYHARRELEEVRNENLEYAEQAEKKAQIVGKATKAYKFYSQGKLSPDHLFSRAKRYAVKLFLAHYHHVAYEVHYGREPEKPYILNQPEHTHFIAPPNWK